MATHSPAVWENGQLLTEWDPENPDKFSDAARKAEAAKWKRLMKNRPPLDALRSSLIARPGKKPPLYYYGFPLSCKYALEYARRHHLGIDLDEEDIEEFGGFARLDFATFDDSRLEADDELRFFAKTMSPSLMVKDLSRRCLFTSDHIGRPFTEAWDGVVSWWSNYNLDKRLACCDDERVIEILKAATNETDDHKSLKPQGWFDWENDVSVFTSVN